MSLFVPPPEKDVLGRVEGPAGRGYNSDEEEDETPLEPFFNYRLIDEKDVKNVSIFASFLRETAGIFRCFEMIKSLV